MLRAIILNRVNSFERQLGESLDYIRFIVRTSLRAFFAFSKIMKFAAYRRVLPVDAAGVAHIVASRDEDCGTCVQISINVARHEGVPVEHIQAVMDRDVDSLPEALADVYRFTEAVVEHTGAEDELRERIRGRYGDEGLIELAMAIAGARVFPVTKRVLGYAKSCSLVELHV